VLIFNSVVTNNEVQYLSKSTSIWEFVSLSKSKSTLKKSYLSKSKKYRSFLNTF